MMSNIPIPKIKNPFGTVLINTAERRHKMMPMTKQVVK